MAKSLPAEEQASPLPSPVPGKVMSAGSISIRSPVEENSFIGFQRKAIVPISEELTKTTKKGSVSSKNEDRPIWSMKVPESILYEVLKEGSESNGLRFTSLENGKAPKQKEMCEGLILKSMKSTIQISFSVHSGSTYVLKVSFKSFHLNIIHLAELQKGTKLCNLCLQSAGYYRFPTLLSADGASNIDSVDEFSSKIVNFVVLLKNNCDAGEGDADRNGNADGREIIENVDNADHEVEDGNADDGEENGNANDGEVNGEEHGVEENAEDNGHHGLLEVENWVEVFRVTTDHVQHFLGNLDKAQWHGPADVLNAVRTILAQEGDLPGYDTPAIEDYHMVCYTEEHHVLNFPVLLVPWDDFVNGLHAIHAIDPVGLDSGKRKRKRLCDESEEEEEEGKKKPKRLSCQLGNEYDDGDGSEIKNEDNAGDETEEEEEEEDEDEDEEEEIENVDNAGDEVENGNADDGEENGNANDGEVNGEEHGDEENAEDHEFADWVEALEAELMNMVTVYRVTPDHILHILGHLDKGQCHVPEDILNEVKEILAQEGELPGYDTPAIEDYRIVFYTEEDDLLNYPLLLPWDEFRNELVNIHAIDPVGSDSGEETV